MAALAFAGHFILIFFVCICVLIMISIAKNPKYKKGSGETLGDILKMGSKKHKDGLKMSKR